MNKQDEAVSGKIDWDISRGLIAGKLKNEVLFNYIQQRHLYGLLTAAERNWIICLLYLLGKGRVTYEEIGECFGRIGRERVRQILERAGLDGLEKTKKEEIIRAWLGKFVIGADNQKLIKAVMQKVASDKNFWITDIENETAVLKRLRVGKVLKELGMPFVGEVYDRFVWKTLVGLGLIEEDGLLGVVLRYGLGWNQARVLDFFRVNYFDKEGATLGDVLAKINDLACKKGLLTIASSQTVADFLIKKGLKPKNRGCSNPAWLYKKQRI